MIINWDEAAMYVKKHGYATMIDNEECFFICPECEEPIYKDDYDEFEFDENAPKGAECVKCPICEYLI